MFSFIIFSVAFAVVRNLYRNVTGRRNIKKELKKRMKRAIGDDLEGEQRESFMGNQGRPLNNETYPRNDEESKSGNGYSSQKKDGYFASLKDSAKGAYDKIKGKKPDIDQYEVLDGSNQNPENYQDRGVLRTTFPTGAVNLAEMSFSVDKTDTEKIQLDPPLENPDQPNAHLEE